MNKRILLCSFLLIQSVTALFSQERLNEFMITPDGKCPFTIRPGDGEYGFVVINTTLSDLRFSIPTAPRRLAKADFNSEKQQWILTIVPNDNNYKRYRITVNSDGFKQGEIEVLVKQKESQCFDVNPKYSSVLEKLARIAVYDKDGNLLVGAVVKDKTTGIVYGSTRYDGTLAINFDNKGESANVIVSHPSYSDTKEITVQAGVHDYEVYLRNYSIKEREKINYITTFFTLNGSYSFMPFWSCGFKVGQIYDSKKVGWYISALSNFSFTGAFHPFKEGEQYDLTGKSHTTRISAMGGLVVRVAKPVAIHAGVGFGYFTQSFQTQASDWYSLPKKNYLGADVALGMAFHIKKFMLSVEAVSTNFKTIELKAGIGFALQTESKKRTKK